MKVFFDFEFTGLTQNTMPISLGLVDENGASFYAEFTEAKSEHFTEWINENVLPGLRFADIYESAPLLDFEHHDMKANRHKVMRALIEWLSQYEQVQMWGDCLAYDWILFCELFGGAMNIPAHVSYIPLDIATCLYVQGYDPDVNREEFSGLEAGKRKHNALWDAKVIRAIYFKLFSSKV